jgi:mannose-6-phosphate isomerase
VAEIRRLLEWGRHQALPFWSDRSWDERGGGFYETLDLQGAGVRGDVRRVRVQARQAYVFARCAHEGWLDRLDLATGGLDRLYKLAWNVGGEPGWVHTLNDDGSVRDTRRDLYDQAFVILACAWVYKATGETRYRDMAYDTLAFLDDHMADPRGGYVEAIGADLLPRRQNPHMHLFEALLALYEVAGDEGLRPRLDAIRTLFDRHFYDSGHGVLREFFRADWVPHGEKGHIVEPGHLCEWVWLLAEYSRLTGVPAAPAGIALFAQAMTSGVNTRTGLLMARMTPSGEALDAGSRTWMQTEWVRAAAVEAVRGSASGEKALKSACAALYRHHLEPAVPGGWIDAVAEDGSGVSSGMPASTLYHVLGCLLELDALGTREH